MFRAVQTMRIADETGNAQFVACSGTTAALHLVVLWRQGDAVVADGDAVG